MFFLAQITPYVVQVIEAPAPETTVADVLLGAVGLTTIIVLGAVLFGLVLGGILVGFSKLWPGNRLNGQTASERGLHLNTLAGS
jgi:hypothetical protein